MLLEIERFVHWVHLRSPAAHTWRDYGYDLRLFASVVGNLPLDQVTFREVDRFIASQSGRGLKPNTIPLRGTFNRRLAAIISLYANRPSDILGHIRHLLPPSPPFPSPALPTTDC
jgi:hypothetical protein